MTLSGIGFDDTAGHGHVNHPYRSIIRRADLTLALRHHASKAQAALRILEAIRDHEAYAAAGNFRLSQHSSVNREVLDNLVALAREAVEAEARAI